MITELHLPLRYEQITIDQATAATNDRVGPIDLVAIFTGLDIDELLQAPQVLIDEAEIHLKHLLSSPTRKFKHRIEYKGKEYGFIPDWGQFTAGEYADIMHYLQTASENASEIMGILYREITRSEGSYYEIISYHELKKRPTHHQPDFGDLPIELFHGAALFFCRIINSYGRNGLYSLEKTQKILKKRTEGKIWSEHSDKSGGGMRLFWRLATMTFWKLKRSLRSRWNSYFNTRPS